MFTSFGHYYLPISNLQNGSFSKNLVKITLFGFILIGPNYIWLFNKICPLGVKNIKILVLGDNSLVLWFRSWYWGQKLNTIVQELVIESNVKYYGSKVDTCGQKLSSLVQKLVLGFKS